MQGNIFAILQGLFDFFCLFLSRSRFKFVCRVHDPLRDLSNLPATSKLCSRPGIIFSGFLKHFRDFLDYFFLFSLVRVFVRSVAFATYDATLRTYSRPCEHNRDLRSHFLDPSNIIFGSFFDFTSIPPSVSFVTTYLSPLPLPPTSEHHY